MSSLNDFDFRTMTSEEAVVKIRELNDPRFEPLITWIESFKSGQDLMELLLPEGGYVGDLVLPGDDLQNEYKPLTVLDLVKLSKSQDACDREKAAINHDTPAGILSILAKDPEAFVRESVASNRSTPPDVLAEMGNTLFEYDATVLKYIALNTMTPKKTLALLARSGNYVAADAVRNPSIDESVLYELLDQTKETAMFGLNGAEAPDFIHKHIRANIGQNPNCPEDILFELVEDKDQFVRNQMALMCRNISVLTKLTEDSDPEVRSRAIFSLEEAKRRERRQFRSSLEDAANFDDLLNP